MFKYIFYKIGQFLVNRLSLGASYKLGVFLSDLQYYCSPRDRRSVTNNLRIILPSEKNLTPLTREVFRNFGRYLIEFFKMVNMVDEAFVKERVTIENLDYIKKALEKGKGGILVSGHIGNWEIGGIFLSLLGYPTVAVALPHKVRPVNDLFNHQREAKGITVVPIHLAIRKCLEALRENKLIALVVDRDFTLTGEVVDFLGRKTLMPKGPAILSLKTGSPIIPIFILRKNNDHFLLRVEEPIYPSKIVEGEVEREDQIHLMKKYTAVIETKVRQYPTQWLFFREFWVK